MVRQVQEGKDIIYGVRKERKTDTFFKRFTAQAFYKLMRVWIRIRFTIMPISA